MVFVREDIPSKLISKETLDIEGIFIELNFRKKKWLLSCSYNPNRNTITDHLEILRRNLDLYSAHYENLIIIGDFNTDINQSCMKSFCESYTLSSLIKEPTCHKNPQNPSCIDLILKNSPYSFQNSCAIETGLSDFHKMTVTVMKTTYEKLKPRIANYRDYKNFCNDTFRQKLLEKLVTENINTNCSGLEKFLQICVNTLNNLAPCKKKYSRGNNIPFMNKSLTSAHMKRSRLRNLYLKDKTETSRIAYIKQRNFCVSLLQKTIKDHYANLDEKDVADNKQFWKTVKPLLSNKVKSSEKITLVEGEEIITEDGENAEILNKFFSNAVKNLKIPEYQEADPLANNISHPIFRAMMKFRNHPSVIAIKNLNRVNVEDVEKEIRRLSTRKATQYSDLPVKILKENSDIFGKYICEIFNEWVDKGTFPSILKHANITPVFKKRIQRFEKQLSDSEHSSSYFKNI